MKYLKSILLTTILLINQKNLSARSQYQIVQPMDLGLEADADEMRHNLGHLFLENTNKKEIVVVPRYPAQFKSLQFDAHHFNKISTLLEDTSKVSSWLVEKLIQYMQPGDSWKSSAEITQYSGGIPLDCDYVTDHIPSSVLPYVTLAQDRLCLEKEGKNHTFKAGPDPIGPELSKYGALITSKSKPKIWQPRTNPAMGLSTTKNRNPYNPSSEVTSCSKTVVKDWLSAMTRLASLSPISTANMTAFKSLVLSHREELEIIEEVHYFLCEDSQLLPDLESFLRYWYLQVARLRDIAVGQIEFHVDFNPDGELQRLASTITQKGCQVKWPKSQVGFGQLTQVKTKDEDLRSYMLLNSGSLLKKPSSDLKVLILKNIEVLNGAQENSFDTKVDMTYQTLKDMANKTGQSIWLPLDLGVVFEFSESDDFLDLQTGLGLGFCVLTTGTSLDDFSLTNCDQ